MNQLFCAEGKTVELLLLGNFAELVLSPIAGRGMLNLEDLADFTKHYQGKINTV